MKKYFVGVMTGTSLDGIDVAVAEFDIKTGSSISIHSYNTYPFSLLYKIYIKKLIHEETTLEKISMLNYYLGHAISKTVLKHLEEHNISPYEVEAIGAHGQTIWHQPEKKKIMNTNLNSTLQALSGPVLAVKSGIEAITDFRAADIAAGGSGAPLQPIFDHYFLRESGKDVVVLNIGGISNITFLEASGYRDDIIAFDTGPGNILIDSVMSKLYNKDYDEDGDVASTGRLNHDLLYKLLSISFINNDPPKSTGRELFNIKLLEDLDAFSIKSQDLVCTLTHYTALSISKNIENYCTTKPFILKASGGGARNKMLMRLLADYIPNAEVQLITLDDKDITDSREALLFAFLAYLRKNKIHGNITSVTGAKREKILGSVSLP